MSFAVLSCLSFGNDNNQARTGAPSRRNVRARFRRSIIPKKMWFWKWQWESGEEEKMRGGGRVEGEGGGGEEEGWEGKEAVVEAVSSLALRHFPPPLLVRLPPFHFRRLRRLVWTTTNPLLLPIITFSSADASISTLPSLFLCHSPTLAVNLLLSSAGKWWLWLLWWLWCDYCERFWWLRRHCRRSSWGFVGSDMSWVVDGDCRGVVINIIIDKTSKFTPSTTSIKQIKNRKEGRNHHPPTNEPLNPQSLQ